MKKAIPLIILLLVLLLAFLQVTAYALPRTFDKSRVHRLDDYRVELKIRDMAFAGKFTNAELTDEKLEEMVKKVLSEMGLDEADFDLLNDLVNTMNQYDSISPEQMQKIFDRWFDMIGAVPVAGQAATLVQIIIQLNGGDYSGPAQSAAEEAGSQIAEGLGDALDISGNAGKVAGSAWGIGKALKAVIEGMMDSDTGERAVDRALGLEAYRLIEEFYGKLNSEVDKHFQENAPNFMVKFEGAKASKPFSLYGTQNSENWTLNMTLFQTESDSRLDIDGKYEGQYTIEIEYDLNGFQGGLSDIVQTEEWRKTYIVFPEWESTWGIFDVSVTNPETCNVKRTLDGYATAILYRKNGKSSIKPTQDQDIKDVNVSGMMIRASAGDAESRLDIGCSVSANESAFTNAMTNWTVTWPDDVFDGSASEHKYDIAWDESIWRRGNNADEDWEISLAPFAKQ